MPIRPIIGPDNPVWRRKARPVEDPTAPEVQKLIDDMIATLRHASGVGLAAPQVAVGQRVAVIEYADVPDDLPEDAELPSPRLYVVINPEIVRRSDTMVEGPEGCLSLPGYNGIVLRHESVVVKAINRRGQSTKIKAHGWLARIFQHEIDHLDGILYIDRATQVWKVREDDGEPEELARQ
jgi:peptide deformylase